MNCSQCQARIALEHSEAWRNAEMEADVTRTLWAISLTLFWLCVIFTHPWVQ